LLHNKQTKNFHRYQQYQQDFRPKRNLIRNQIQWISLS